MALQTAQVKAKPILLRRDRELAGDGNGELIIGARGGDGRGSRETNPVEGTPDFDISEAKAPAALRRGGEGEDSGDVLKADLAEVAFQRFYAFPDNPPGQRRRSCSEIGRCKQDYAILDVRFGNGLPPVFLVLASEACDPNQGFRDLRIVPGAELRQELMAYAVPGV